MQNLKYLKYIVLTPLVILVIYFSVSLFTISSLNTDIKTVKKISLNEQTNNKKTNIITKKQNTEPQKISSSFNYKLIGYLAGPSDSSVILKKGSNEFLIRIGDEIDSYKLESVSKEEVIFSLQNKLYKIENNVGKNK
jgi:hypothetical protein